MSMHMIMAIRMGVNEIINLNVNNGIPTTTRMRTRMSMSLGWCTIISDDMNMDSYMNIDMCTRWR